MNRFEVVRFERGILLVDLVTGEVRRIPFDGSATELLPPQVLPSDTRPGDLAALRVPRPDLPPSVPEGAVVAPWPTVAPPRPTGADAIEEASRGPDPLTGIPPSDVQSRDVVTAYPYPIARAWSRFLREPDPRIRRWALVDTFGAALKLWAFAAGALYVRSGLRDEAVDELLVRDLQRPLLSVWQLLLDRALPLLRDRSVIAGEADAAWRSLAREHVVVRGANARLSPVNALLKLRNEVAHGSLSQTDKARDEVAEFEPLLRRLLEAQSFLARFPLHRVSGHDGALLRTERWTGSGGPAVAPPLASRDVDVAVGAFLLRASTEDESLPMLEFVTTPGRNDAPAVGLFEGYTKKACVYVSLDGDHWQSDEERPRWGKRIEGRGGNRAALDLGRITLEHVASATLRATQGQLSAFASAAITIPDTAYLPRTRAERWLDQLDASELRAAVFGGEAGVGKSLLIHDRARRALSAGDLVLVYRGATLPDADLGRTITRDLGIRQAYVEDVLARVHDLLPEGKMLRIFVDGVDQHPGELGALVRGLDALVAQLAPLPKVRLVATVRERAYLRLPSSARLGRQADARYLRADVQEGPSELLPLGPFDDAEVQRAYERYRSASETDGGGDRSFRARPITPFADLAPSGSTVGMLREPSLMRLLLETYHGRRLRSELDESDIVREYLRRTILPEGSGFDLEARRRFLRGVARHFDERGDDAIAIQALYDDPVLRADALNPERESPFVQLIEAGVLEVVHDGTDASVRFVRSRLLVHLVAARREADLDSPATRLALLRRACRHSLLAHVLETLLRDAVRTEREGVLTDLAADADHDGTTDVRTVASAAVASTLAHFGQTEPRRLEAAIEVGGTQTETFRRALIAAAAACLRSGSLPAAEALVGAARRYGAAAGAARDEASAELVAARIDAHRGARDAALAKVARAEALVGRDDPELGRDLALMSTQLLLNAGRTEEAANRIAGWAERMRDSGDARFEARMHLLEGTIARSLGDAPRQVACNDRALALARELRDEDTAARALNNLGLAYREVGRTADAGRCLEEALASKRRLGDEKAIANSLANLGAFHLDFGEGAARAQGYFEEALRRFENVGFVHGVHVARVNLTLATSFARGEYAAAAAAFADVLAQSPSPGITVEVQGFRAMAALGARDLVTVRSARDAIAGAKGPRVAEWTAAVDLGLAALEGPLEAILEALPALREILTNGTRRPLFALPITPAVLAAERLVREGRTLDAASVREWMEGALAGRSHPAVAISAPT